MDDLKKSLELAAHAMDNDAFAKYVGSEVLEMDHGHAVVRLKLRDEHLNFLKIPHGAVVFAVADQAFAAACNSHGRVAVALNVSINFLAAAQPGSVLTATAREVSLEKKTGLYDIVVTDEKDRKIASFQGLAFRKTVTYEQILGTGE